MMLISCILLYSSCLMPHASCLMPHASCLMPHASCLIIYFRISQNAFRISIDSASIRAILNIDKRSVSFANKSLLKVGCAMKTMTINGFSVSYVEKSVDLDKLGLNPDNSRTAGEQEENAERIHDSMRPKIDSKNRRNAFRADKFVLYVVATKTGFRTICGNGSLGALLLWDADDSREFLQQFPERMIPVFLFDKLSPVELLAIAADHSTGFNSMELSTEQTALEFRRIMLKCKKDTLVEICAKLGYSTGKGKVYYHLEKAVECPELHDLLWNGAILKSDDGNKIRTTHIPAIAAQWSKSDGFAKSNKALWELVERYRVFGNSKGNPAKETSLDKLAKVDSFRAGVAGINVKSEVCQDLLDAFVGSDLATVITAVRVLDKSAVKV